MKGTPGYPGNPLPPVRVEPEVTPPRAPSSHAPGELRISGAGWRVSAPLAVLVSVVAALGVKLLPAQSSTDADMRAEQRLEAMRNAEFREESRRAMAALRDEVAQLRTEVSLVRVSEGARDKRLERLERGQP